MVSEKRSKVLTAVSTAEDTTRNDTTSAVKMKSTAPEEAKPKKRKSDENRKEGKPVLTSINEINKRVSERKKSMDSRDFHQKAGV